VGGGVNMQQLRTVHASHKSDAHQVYLLACRVCCTSVAMPATARWAKFTACDQTWRGGVAGGMHLQAGAGSPPLQLEVLQCDLRHLK
jgi:hypothetical protein